MTEVSWFEDVCRNLSQALNDVMCWDETLCLRWERAKGSNCTPGRIVCRILEQGKGGFFEHQKWKVTDIEVALPDPRAVMEQLREDYKSNSVDPDMTLDRQFLLVNRCDESSSLEAQLLVLYRSVVAHTNTLWIKNELERFRFEESGHLPDYRMKKD